MTAYEFYVVDKTRGRRLIGILPEKRVAQERITHESIMNWANLTFGNIHSLQDIFFKRITVAQNGFGNYYSKERPG